MSMIVFDSPTILTPARVRGLPHSSIESCWLGEVLPSPLWWVVALDPKHLWFAGSLPGGGSCIPGAKHGEFFEGLWEADVFEIFIKDPSGRYFEFNVSPQGAWWATELSAYRERVSYLRLPKVSLIETEILLDRWRALVCLDRDSLPMAISASSTLHVSGVFNEAKSRYLSSNRVANVAPDFHHLDAFQQVSLSGV